MTETYLTMAGLRERGWTDVMIREYLGEPDATRPNPRYRSAAPMKLYLAHRAEAGESSPAWAERKTLAARRRAAGMAVADRKRAETATLARQLAADLVARLVLPADPPEFLHRITMNFVRHELTGYDRAYSRLAGQVGHQEAYEILCSKVNAAVEARLGPPPASSAKDEAARIPESSGS